jgi:hypothetical protein
MRDTSYGEKKEKLNLTVTPTVKKWLNLYLAPVRRNRKSANKEAKV